MKKKLFVLITMLALTGPVFGADQFATLKASGDALWGDRDQLPKLQKCIDAYEKAVQIQPDQEILARLSIGYYWLGNLNPGKSNKKFRKEAYTKGMAHAKKLTEINPKSAPGIFWDATNNASFCKEKGFMKSAMNVSTITEQANQVMSIDKYYYQGGPQRLLARIYWGTPKFFRKKGGKLKDGVALLNEAISKYPKFALSYIFLGDTYWEMGEKEKSRQTFEKVLTIPETALPQFSAEIRRDHQTAKEKLKEYFKQ